MDNKKPDTNSEPIVGKQTKPADPPPPEQTTDSDFIVTEARGHTQQLVGESGKQEADNDLGIQSTTNLMDDNASEFDAAHTASNDTEQPLADQQLGSSSSILIPEPDQPTEPIPTSNLATDDQGNDVRHLSDKEVKSIRNQLYAESDKPNEKPKASVQSSQKTSPDQAQSTTDKLKPFGNTPIVPREKQSQQDKQQQSSDQLQQQTQIEESKQNYSQRSVARFYNNFIHLPSGTKLRENDEFSLRNKRYVIKRKNISPALVLGVAAPFFVILAVIVIGMFVGGDTGNGRVFGVCVDDYGVPYGGGATIRFTELDKSYTADVQGLFATDQMPAGSHQVEYLVAGTVVGSEYVTIVDNDITSLILAPAVANNQQATEELPSPVPASTDYSAPPDMRSQESNAQVAKAPTPAPIKNKKTPAKEPKLVLAANIEGATLTLDGKVVGIGNTTYPRLTPGKHQYSVTRKGFDTVTGTVNLKARAKKTIEVQLSPISDEAKAEIYTAEDYFYSAEEFVTSGNTQSAINDYSRAIDINPGYAEAYFRRGLANQKAGQKRPAFDDFLRAGEIYQIQRTYSRASSAFSNAIDIFPKAIEPLLGLGHTHLARGENIAAITDFESAVGIDKKNPAARFGLGVARFNHGQYKKATNEFKEARSIDPKDPATHQYLMLSYLARNDTKNVRKSYDRFIENASDKQIVTFHSDKRFTAVVRVIEMEK